MISKAHGCLSTFSLLERFLSILRMVRLAIANAKAKARSPHPWIRPKADALDFSFNVDKWWSLLWI